MEIILIGRSTASANWDYDRFVEASETRRKNQKFFEQVHMGEVTKPATVVDKHGKILIWYLPGLLLPHHVVCSVFSAGSLSFLLTLCSGRVKQC